MKIKAIIIIPLLLAMYTFLIGQVLPPSLDCVTNDTIFFTPLTNSCGPFLSYDVYSATDPDGPYSLLESITNPNAILAEHPNSSSTINFYYITPIFDCPGEISINSDTISNRPPEVGDIFSISVENNFSNISWNPSPSAETTEYSLFLVTDMGVELLLVTPNLSYIDIDRDPSIQSYSYLIVASDACDNRSIFSDPVSSIHLNLIVSGDSCDESIGFEWNIHTNTVSQELWAIDINGNEFLFEALTANDDSIIIEGFTRTDITGFFIRAFLNTDQTLFADSNISNINFTANTPVDEILFTNLSTFNNNNIEVAWCWNDDADLNSVGQTTTIDACEVIFDSAPINSILLEVNPLSESEVEVTWSPYSYPDADLINYQLIKVVNGVEELVYEGLATSQSLSAAAVPGEQCYYTVAQARGFLGDGTEKAIQVISNLDCTSGFPIIRLPNAFNPYGVNSMFRPLIGNADAIESYQMQIFSRWGELLFNTTDTSSGWNGRDGLKEMPQGVYSYIVEVVVVGGEEIKMLGSVLLLR